MNLSSFCHFCEKLPYVTLETPFGPNTLVCKVGGKMFAAVDIQNFESVNVKNSPEKNIELRERFFSVKPGYHMNKKHWNTIEWNGDMDISQILELVKESYEIIFDSLPKRIIEELAKNIEN